MQKWEYHEVEFYDNIDGDDRIDERDERKSQKVQLSDAQKVILEYLQGVEPPKPVKWLKPIKESFKPKNNFLYDIKTLDFLKK